MEDDNEQLMQMVAEVAKNELREDESSRKQLLAQFRDWIAKNSNIVFCRTDDCFLLGFLRMEKFSLPIAQQTLLRFIKLRQTYSHYMYGLDINDEKMDAIISSGFNICSPNRDAEGRSLVISTYGNLDMEKCNMQDVLRAIQLNNATLIEDEITQVMGITYVYNFINMNPKIITLINFTELLDFIHSGENTTPMRHKEFIFYNVPHYATLLLNAVKAVLSKKLQERFFICNTLEELHERVSPKCLPVELGGTLTNQQMTEMWKKKIASKQQNITDLDKMKLRDLKLVELNPELAAISGLNGIQGSFKKLEID